MKLTKPEEAVASSRDSLPDAGRVCNFVDSVLLAVNVHGRQYAWSAVAALRAAIKKADETGIGEVPAGSQYRLFFSQRPSGFIRFSSRIARPCEFLKSLTISDAVAATQKIVETVGEDLRLGWQKSGMLVAERSYPFTTCGWKFFYVPDESWADYLVSRREKAAYVWHAGNYSIAKTYLLELSGLSLIAMSKAAGEEPPFACFFGVPGANGYLKKQTYIGTAENKSRFSDAVAEKIKTVCGKPVATSMLASANDGSTVIFFCASVRDLRNWQWLLSNDVVSLYLNQKEREFGFGC